MKLTKAAAVELFVALGVATASKWAAKRLTDKLKKVNDLVDDDTDLDGTAGATLTAVQEAIENDEEIEIDGEAAKPSKADKAAAAKKKKDDAAAAAKVKKDAKTAAAKKKKDDAAAAKAAAKAAKGPETPGVRDSRSRPFLAGVVIKKHKRAGGVTDKMVEELDAAYGSANPRESKFCLRNAWHAIRGYEDGSAKDLKPPKA